MLLICILCFSVVCKFGWCCVCLVWLCSMYLVAWLNVLPFAQNKPPPAHSVCVCSWFHMHPWLHMWRIYLLAVSRYGMQTVNALDSETKAQSIKFDWSMYLGALNITAELSTLKEMTENGVHARRYTHSLHSDVCNELWYLLLALWNNFEYNLHILSYNY